MNTAPIQRIAALSVVIGALGLWTLTGCDKKKSVIPPTAEGRIEAMAAYLPASTEAAVFIGDVSKFRDTLTTINGTIGDAVPELGATQKQLEAQIGFDPLDANAWKQAGIPDNSAVTVAFVNNRTVIMTFVEDQQKFDTMLAEKAKKALETSEAPKVEKVGDKQVKVLGQDKKQIAWLHDGKLAIITSSVLDDTLGGDKSAPAQFAAALTATEEKASAAKTPQFAQFMKGIDSSYALAAYANMQAALKNEAIKKEFDKEENADTKALLDRFQKEAQVMGIGLMQKDNELKLTAFYGADEATNKEIKELGNPAAKSPFAPFASEGMLIGIRTALDTQKLWAYYMKNLPAEQKEEIMQGLKAAGEQAQLDVEKDLINNLSGNVGIFLYGLNIGGLMGGMNNPNQLVQSLNLAAAVQFKNKESAAMFMDKIKTAIGATPTEADGATILALPEDTAKFYLKDTMLVIGTKEFTQETAMQFLNGKAAQGSLNGSLGKDFASDAPYGGIYINIDKVSALVGAIAAGTPISQVLNKLSEVALTTDSSDAGMFMHLRIILKESAKKAAEPAK